jgi:hypothetical protein
MKTANPKVAMSNENQIEELTASDVMLLASKCNIRFKPMGARLLMESVFPVSARMENLIAVHKSEILRLINQQRHLAYQVLSGEFDGVTGTAWRSVRVQLLCHRHDPICDRALKHLETPDRLNKKTI